MFFAIVTRIDFDSMENRTPHVRSLAAVFTGDTEAAASLNAHSWTTAQETGTYEGYDHATYPQFTTQCGEVGVALTGTPRIYT